MSMRISPRSPSKSHFDTSLASSVLPTPVGPVKRKTPMGRCSSRMPARERRMVRAMRSTASSCPTTRLDRWSRSVRRRAISSPEMRSAGMPVMAVTVWRMCSAVRVAGPSPLLRRQALRSSAMRARRCSSRMRASVARS